MAISGPVQQKIGGNGAASSFTITLDSPPNFGNTLLLGVGTNDSVASVTSSGATWTLVKSSTAHVASYIYAVYNVQPGAGSVITVTLSASAKGAGNVSEWSGLAGFGLDQSDVANGSGTAIASASILPTSDNELVFHATAWQGSAESNGPTGGFTALTKGTGGTLFSASAYQIQAAAASASTTYTIPASGWDSAIASFLAQGVAGPTDVVVAGISVTEDFGSEHRPPWFSPQNRFGRLNSAGQPYAIAFEATSAPAEAATGVGAAADVTAAIAPQGGQAVATGAAADAAVPTISASASAATGAGTAGPPSEAVAPVVGAAAGTGAVLSPSETVAASIGVATATGLAANAAITSSPPDHIVATAQTAAATGQAGDIDALISVSPASLSATGSATAPTVTISPNAGGLAAAGAALTPAIAVKANAGLASGAGTAWVAADSVAVAAQAAAGSGAVPVVGMAAEIHPIAALGSGRALNVLAAGAIVRGGAPPSIAMVVTIRAPLEIT